MPKDILYIINVFLYEPSDASIIDLTYFNFKTECIADYKNLIMDFLFILGLERQITRKEMGALWNTYKEYKRELSKFWKMIGIIYHVTATNEEIKFLYKHGLIGFMDRKQVHNMFNNIICGLTNETASMNKYLPENVNCVEHAKIIFPIIRFTATMPKNNKMTKPFVLSFFVYDPNIRKAEEIQHYRFCKIDALFNILKNHCGYRGDEKYMRELYIFSHTKTHKDNIYFNRIDSAIPHVEMLKYVSMECQ